MNLYARVSTVVACALLPAIILAQQKTEIASTGAAAQTNEAKPSVALTDECCVCPKYRYAIGPIFSSYYSKRCDGDQITYMSVDMNDIGAYPNLDCPGCSSCLSGGSARTPNFASTSHAVMQTLIDNGLQEQCNRDYKLGTEQGAAVLSDFVVKVNLSDDGSKAIYAKLFLTSFKPSGAGAMKVFGKGLETVSGTHDIEVPYKDVVTVSEGVMAGGEESYFSSPSTETHCLRFKLRLSTHTQNLLLNDTEFQVLTKTPVRVKEDDSHLNQTASR